MPGVKLIVAFAACCAALSADHPSTCHVPDLSHPAVRSLQLGGASGEMRSVSYDRLLELPQVTVEVQHDENLSTRRGERFKVTGVYLDVLMRTLGAPPDADMVDVLCSDGYRSVYSSEYLAKHHPLLALKVEGLPEDAWAMKMHRRDPGSFFITQAGFVPSFKVLSQKERALIPADIVRLNFVSSRTVLGAIAPRGVHASDPQAIEGYRIAQQHCFRCHNEGQYGGTKAGKSWEALGGLAASTPEQFERYIRWPQQVDPNAKMPPNLDFDRATQRAMQVYFAGFASDAVSTTKNYAAQNYAAGN